MEQRRIAELLEPFLTSSSHDPASAGMINSAALSSSRLDLISIYIDLLLRWNARVSLTAIRDPDEIVTRHFGESLFAARHLLPSGAGAEGDADDPSGSDTLLPDEAQAPTGAPPKTDCTHRVIDLGSGPGFPGLPMKIWSPGTPITLIEANQKKVAFLREVIRALTLTDIDVFPRRGEDYSKASASLVTLRAVERFEDALATACPLLAVKGRMALLIGQSQVTRAHRLAGSLAWDAPLPIPNSKSRVLLVGHAT